MKGKRIAAAFLALAMTLTLAACGGSEGPGSSAAASGSGFQLCVSVPASGTARYETFISAIYF